MAWITWRLRWNDIIDKKSTEIIFSIERKSIERENNSTGIILKNIFILGRINQKIKKIIIYHT